jgi:tyrosyl-tRNA synthetase
MILGTDGKTMSKTSGNCIFLDEKPEDMYSKLMGVHDDLVPTYFELLTDIPVGEIKTLNPDTPIENKKRLAYDITRQFHGDQGAQAGQKYFEEIVRTKSAPTDTPVVKATSDMSLLETLKNASLGVSNGDIKRTIEQGGVEIDGVKIVDPSAPVTAGTLKFGKHAYRKIEI